MQHIACPRIAVSQVADILPPKFIADLEQNQLIASCCRHPEDHEIEALYSSDADKERGVPDIYIFHCTCGRKHRRFCVGGSPGSGSSVLEKRPFWELH